MCRFAAYLGPPVPLSSLIYEPPHSLEVQAYAPKAMVSGTVNVDGTGVAWWRPGVREPLRYVSDKPPWTDANLPSLAPRLEGSPILAVVRSATAGMPAGVGAAHPFVCDGLAGSHNGYLGSFKEAVGWPLLKSLPGTLRAQLDTVSDSLVLFLLVVAARMGDPGLSLPDAAVTAVENAARACSRAGAKASLNLVVADQQQVVAVRAARGVEPNSLYALEAGALWPEARLIASEPLDDDPGWEEVAPGRVVTLSATGMVSEQISS
ncbi:MAG: ergothioneine biosynthesis protein EgtC [Acidobacteriota bacterium]